MSENLDLNISEFVSEPGWKKFENSPEQLAEMDTATHGYLVRYIAASGFDVGEAGSDVIFGTPQDPEIINEYWIVPDDPLREMKKRQAETGQPIWTRQKSMLREGEWFYLGPTTAPPWFMEDAEFSFRPFKENCCVCAE